MKPTKHFKTVEVPDNPEPVIAVEQLVHQPGVTKEFLLSGRAFFQVKSPAGRVLTFKVHARDGLGRYASEVTYFLRVLNATTQTFQYVGVVLENGSLKVTARSKYVQGTPEFDVGQWVLQTVFAGLGIPDGYTITHIGKCGKCGKLLGPASEQESGIHDSCRLSTE